MNETFWGATYNTEPGPQYGEITDVFEVESDWQGFRYHGYCVPTPFEMKEFFDAK